MSCQSIKKLACNIESVASPKGTDVFQPNWDNIAENYKFPDWFVDGKFGIFIHWGPYSVPAFNNEWYARHMYLKDHKVYKHHIETWGPQEKFGYKDFIPLFKAEKFNVKEWVEVFKKSGAKYVVPVAEHHDGFSMYNSDLNEWNSVKMGPKKDIIGALKKEMYRLVMADLPIEKYSMNTDEAVALFHELGMKDKEKLFRYRRSSRVNIYELDHYKDYFYGFMVPSTGYLRYYDVTAYQDGFVLLFPGKEAKKVSEFVPSDKLFFTLKRSRDWGKLQQIDTIGALNDAIAAGKTQEMILTQEALFEERIGALAEMIVKEEGKKFIMIAGPSSSGKTTFSHRLSIQLAAKGLKPHPFPLDDYYVDRDKCPRDENGELDFECLESLDVELFNHDMNELLAGKAVNLPIFNFKTGKREYKDKIMQLGKDDVLVIEGIHGLNDKLSYSLPVESKFKIYISALTQLNIDEHNYLPTTDGRMIRRIVRDARTRGTSAKETIAMWDSVRRGEEKNIFPFQEGADVMFNSALIYELAVLKIYAEPLLFAIDKDCPEYLEAKRLLKFLDYFLLMSPDGIGQNSIIREFIGGSCFNV